MYSAETRKKLADSEKRKGVGEPVFIKASGLVEFTDKKPIFDGWYWYKSAKPDSVLAPVIVWVTVDGNGKVEAPWWANSLVATEGLWSNRLPWPWESIWEID